MISNYLDIFTVQLFHCLYPLHILKYLDRFMVPLHSLNPLHVYQSRQPRVFWHLTLLVMKENCYFDHKFRLNWSFLLTVSQYWFQDNGLVVNKPHWVLWGVCLTPHTVFMKIIGHVGHFWRLGLKVWWEISQIWIEYIKPIGQMSDDGWKFFGYTAHNSFIGIRGPSPFKDVILPV